MKTWCLTLVLAGGIAAADERPTGRPVEGAGPQLHLQSNFGISGWSRGLAAERGSAWGVIVGYFPFDFAGVEVQYVGATNDVARGSFVHVTTGGGLLDLRVGFPRRVGPFAFAGVGFVHLDLAGTAARQSTTSAVWPVGAGIEGRVRGSILVGARFTYGFLGSSIAGVGAADLWTVTANLGTSIQ